MDINKVDPNDEIVAMIVAGITAMTKLKELGYFFDDKNEEWVRMGEEQCL